jgi:hypothetical protein
MVDRARLRRTQTRRPSGVGVRGLVGDQEPRLGENRGAFIGARIGFPHGRCIVAPAEERIRCGHGRRLLRGQGVAVPVEAGPDLLVSDGIDETMTDRLSIARGAG